MPVTFRVETNKPLETTFMRPAFLSHPRIAYVNFLDSQPLLEVAQCRCTCCSTMSRPILSKVSQPPLLNVRDINLFAIPKPGMQLQDLVFLLCMSVDMLILNVDIHPNRRLLTGGSKVDCRLFQDPGRYGGEH